MKSYCLLIALLIAGTAWSAPKSGADKQRKVYIPVIDGEWWNITSAPDPDSYNSDAQEAVDFGVWQAVDGTFLLRSCIRNTQCGGHTRLPYGWEGQSMTDRD